MMIFTLRGKTYKAGTYATLSRRYAALRDASEEGASTFDCPRIYDEFGEVVGRFSYNGRIWRDEPWTVDSTPIYDNRVEA